MRPFIHQIAEGTWAVYDEKGEIVCTFPERREAERELTALEIKIARQGHRKTPRRRSKEGGKRHEV